jgi:hypothetical protein
MPRVSVSTAIAAKAGDFESTRTAYTRSRANVVIGRFYFAVGRFQEVVGESRQIFIGSARRDAAGAKAEVERRALRIES